MTKHETKVMNKLESERIMILMMFGKRTKIENRGGWLSGRRHYDKRGEEGEQMRYEAVSGRPARNAWRCVDTCCTDIVEDTSY